MEVPVYLFTGFLDSGKSTFIQDTLRDPQFHQQEQTLLLLCEDGEVEFDPIVMADYHVDIVRIEKESDLTYEYLTRLHRQYHPQRVMIEFNGMWNVTAFLDVEYPIEWILVQIMTTIDASTFALYMNNMRSILYDQMVHSELIIFNRCDASTKKSFLRNNVKAINKGAQLIYESVDGAINQLADDILPFDIHASDIEIQDDDYGLWYIDVMEKPHAYEGKHVTFHAQVVEVDHHRGNIFLIGREAMVCCADDIQMIGFVVHYQDSDRLKSGEWIQLRASIRCEFDEQYGGDVAVLYAERVSAAEAIQDLVTFS